MIVGPLVGGAINDTGDWRWVFYLNLPGGALALIISMFALPNRFPRHCEPRSEKKSSFWSFETTLFQKIDFLGAILLLAASVLLVAMLEEGEVRSLSRAGLIIAYVVAAVLFALFLLWERYASRPSSTIEPMFPWRLVPNRIWMGVLFGCFLSGAPLTIAVIELPQRYQLVNEDTPLRAGIALLAYAACTPVGIVLANLINGRLKIPFVFVLLVGIALQTASFALLSTLPNTIHVWPGEYGYSVLAGLGTGTSIGTLYMMVPNVVEKRDQPLAIGSALQVRMLGGAVGIAVVNAVLNSYVRLHLRSTLTVGQLDAILQSASRIKSLTPALQEIVRVVYGQAYNLQLRVTIAFTAAQFLAVILMWKRKPLRLGKDGRPE